MDDKVIDNIIEQIYNETINDVSMPRYERIKLYIKKYLELTKTNKD